MRHTSAISPHAREFCISYLPSEHQRAQGKPGARRTRSLACKIKKHTSVVTTGLPSLPGLPCAMVLTAYFALSPVTGLFCHRRFAETSAKLDTSVGASGPHDFAVRISIIRRTRCCEPDAAASIASRAQRPWRSRYAPLCGTGWREF